MPPIRHDATSITETLRTSPIVLQSAQALMRDAAVSIKTLRGSAKAAYVSALCSMGDLPFIVIVPTDDDVEAYVHDISILVASHRVAGMRGAQKHSALASGGAVHHEQVEALRRIRHDASEPYIVVISAAALALAMPSEGALTESELALERATERNYDELITSLALAGFERTDFVSKPGELAVRGGILDVFPSGWDNPLRIEFFGNTIESIREFEPLSQRSIREHSRVTFLAHVFHDDDPTLSSTIIDHLPRESVMVLDEPEAIESELHVREISSDVLNHSAYVIRLNPLGTVSHEVSTHVQPPSNGSLEHLLQTASKYQRKSYSVLVGGEGQQNTKRLRELCEAFADQVELDAEDAGLALHRVVNGLTWMSVSLTSGFIWDEISLAVLTEHQVFGRQRAQRRSSRQDSGMSIRDIQQLHRGDLVVHADKGIGRFEGLETIVINGSQVECVKLGFDGGDHLFVHLNYVHKLSKYASEEGSVPKLSKLGSAEWERKKARAKKRIKDIARDLIKLYAQRKSQPGYAYPTDTVWQKEFEASFQYEDTVDQARATSEVKHDMELPTPMDRLVCGDVGFGKTEIAVRAAFKAAQSGRQVAVLVPTTILAEQHGVTFRDRLHRYPVRIDVLSRFRSKTEQKDIIDRIHSGGADIVIGTHRLLSKDVSFKNLGLLIIDEEHRFGVAAKEKLRQLRVTIDTLTLTATPIPRTLNFSLMGARDLSVIETPPRNRLPVRTEISQWDDTVLREALLRELERGGQVFVVTDRITDMDKLVMKIKMLVPTLRVTMAHGQMETDALEDVMEGFLERKYDVLVATKIIESGLDIPNANTMIIEHADNFGLAELYQLRGRVGRSNIQAYCYLLIPPPHTLSRMALRRLQALEEYTDLGSGFQLAMRDLEIRGAGNLLGGEQSGFILDMGFELYQKILDEAVEELKHDEFAELFAGSKELQRDFSNEDIAVELDTDALLPRSYIPADTERFDVYKRLYNAHDIIEVDRVYDELRDRFGLLPPEAEELLFAVKLRILALPSGIVRLNVRGNRLVMELPPDTQTAWYSHVFKRILQALTTMPNAKFVQQGKRLIIDVVLGNRDEAQSIVAHISSVATARDIEHGSEEQSW